MEGGPNTSASIRLVEKGIDVSQLQDILKDPSLWDHNKARTSNPDSPHYGCHDIWARYAPVSEYGLAPHSCIWYPVVETGRLHILKDIAENVLDIVGGATLLGVLITKIPPGESVKPHTDSGWHAEVTEKYGLSVQANDKQAFCFHDGSLVTEPGDLFWFYNLREHWVTNDSNEDRISVIFCVKRE